MGKSFVSRSRGFRAMISSHLGHALNLMLDWWSLMAGAVEFPGEQWNEEFDVE